MSVLSPVSVSVISAETYTKVSVEEEECSEECGQRQECQCRACRCCSTCTAAFQCSFASPDTALARLLLPNPSPNYR